MADKVHYEVINEKIIRTVILEFFFLVILLISTHIIAESVASKYTFYGNNMIRNSFENTGPWLKHYQYHAIDFKNVRTIDDVFTYIYINCLYILHEDVVISPEDVNKTQYLSLMAMGMIIGRPRIRQKRVKQMKKCIHDVRVEGIAKIPCFPEYSNEMEFKERFQGLEFTKDAASFWTDSYIYSGGGYSINLHLNFSDNQNLVQSLYNSVWIDRRTRLVVLEFNVFYDNTEMFRIIKVMFEIFPTGLVLPTCYVQSIPVKCFLSQGNFMLFLGIVFYALVAYYSYQEFHTMRSEGLRNYAKMVNNYPDFFLVITSYIVLAYNVLHPILVHNIEDAFKRNMNRYVNMDSLHQVWDIYVLAMGILVFSAWLKLIRFGSFHRTLKRLAITLSLSFKNILGFVFVYLVAVCAFAQLGTILFGDRIEHFKTNFSSALFIMRILMCDVEFMPMYKAEPVLASIYFVIVIVTIYGISLNLFVAIFVSTYSEVKRNMIVMDTEVYKMFLVCLKNIFCFWRKRDNILERKVFELQIIKQTNANTETQVKKPKLELMLSLREDLANLSERAIQIEKLLQIIVNIIDDISEMQKSIDTQQRQPQNV